VSGFEIFAITDLVLVVLAIAELCYSRPRGWGWWILSILLVPLIFAVMSLAQAPKSIAYRRRLNQIKRDAAKDVFT
jgi:hypothetical protein